VDGHCENCAHPYNDIVYVWKSMKSVIVLSMWSRSVWQFTGKSMRMLDAFEVVNGKLGGCVWKTDGMLVYPAITGRGTYKRLRCPLWRSRSNTPCNLLDNPSSLFSYTRKTIEATPVSKGHSQQSLLQALTAACHAWHGGSTARLYW
jgi:hypothetical protein